MQQHHRSMSRLGRIALFASVGAMFLIATHAAADEAGPYFATGIKIGEVTDQSALVWARLTRRAERNPADGPIVRIEYEKDNAKRRERAVSGIFFPDGKTVADLREGAPGADGDVRVLWKTESDSEWQKTTWRPVRSLRDFTRQFALDDLQPATKYVVRVESRGVDKQPGATIDGKFRTAPKSNDSGRVVFAAATCFGNDDYDSPQGFKVY
jgi:alkaline phosphatase D